VPEGRLLKLNDAGKAKRRQLVEQQTLKNRPGVSTTTTSTGKGKEKGSGKKAEGSKKRGRMDGPDTVRPPRGWSLSPVISVKVLSAYIAKEVDYVKRPEVKIVIPDILKLQLVDDWENVTKNNQV
jgi:mortality factor 4-like protein 1